MACRRQAIIWTNAGQLSTGPLRTNFNEIFIIIHTFSFKNIQFKMSSRKWWPSCLSLNVLTFPIWGKIWEWFMTIGLFLRLTMNLSVPWPWCPISNEGHSRHPCVIYHNYGYIYGLFFLCHQSFVWKIFVLVFFWYDKWYDNDTWWVWIMQLTATINIITVTLPDHYY